MAKERSKAKKKVTADNGEVSKKSKKPKKDAPKTGKPKRKKKISPEERIEMIRTAAYYLAEKRGQHGNYELDDWIAAEKEIDATTK